MGLGPSIFVSNELNFSKALDELYKIQADIFLYYRISCVLFIA